MKKLLEQLRGDGYSGRGSRVQAKAAFVAVGGAVVVAGAVESLAQQPVQSLGQSSIQVSGSAQGGLFTLI